MTQTQMDVNCELSKTDIIRGIIKAGCLCLPASSNTKYCYGLKWSEYKKPLSLEQFNALSNGFDGICIITGQRSGNLEVLDFDKKIDPHIFNELLIEYKDLVESEAPGLFEKLVIEKTQSGGRHIFFKCPGEKISGNTKLSFDKVEVDGPGQHEHFGDTYTARQNHEGKWCIYPCVVETRGEGGLIVCYPTPGYELTQGKIDQVPDISAHERDILIRCAQAFNQYIEPERMVTGGQKLDSEELRPGDDFTQREDIIPTLKKHGWLVVSTVGNYTRIRRPGKADGWSASLIDGKILYVFSTNTEFEPERGYTIFAVYAILEHGGDFRAAAKDLAAQGYGDQKQEQSLEAPLPAPPSFPLDVLPFYFQESIQQAVKAFSVPPEVPAATLLSLVGALIGRSRAAVVKSGWTEHPNLYIVIVAPSGMGKSPCVRAFMKSIFREEKRRFDEFQQALAQYQEEMNARKRMKQNELGPPPEKPTWKQIYVEDATEEALTDALSANAKGILWYVDEISGLIMNLGRYRNDGKSDGPKARLMSAYDSGPWKRTRKSGDNAFISHACLSILGTLQPALLPNLFADIDAASGFLPRFIFVRAEPSGPPLWTDESFDGEYRERIDQLVGDLMSREMGEEPAYIGLTTEAQPLYREWYNEQAREPWVNFDAQQYEALSAKLRGQCARLALILHVLECHAQGMDDTQPIQPATMERALILANWIKAHQRNVWQALTQSEQITHSSPIEKRIAAAIGDLEGEISEGKLPISRITEQVNNGAEKAYQVKPETVGKGLKKIGLHSSKGTGGKRLVHISEQKLESLKQTASPATTATFSEMTRSAGGWHVQENRHYCHQGPKEGMAGVAGEKDLPLSGNKHESRESGRCGSSGRSEGTENKLDFNNAKPQRTKI
ncbi:MAG: DUF3987 domain-containing protein [Desulfovermiculus sp.]